VADRAARVQPGGSQRGFRRRRQAVIDWTTAGVCGIRYRTERARMEPTTLKLREGGIADIDAFTRLVNTAFAVERFILDEERIDQGQRAGLFRTGKILLAEQDRSLVGGVYLELRDASGYLGLLSVEPSRQRQGIGRHLVNTAENWFRSQRRSIVQLQIINVRRELLDVYRRPGYRETGTSPFPPDLATHLPCHFIKMTKCL
jgi:GNAT superfamily N-acetyltransferase